MFSRAAGWLVAAGCTLQYASADERAQASLIEERLAAGPFMIGNVNVFDNNKVRQDTIEVGNHRKFYFRKSATPFFEITP